ncbi:Proto-oncogene tyrosine-protein kinase receptor Ret [Orchesella cincta]|uniref:Proto-oncogene tyrosine-protein kinase receptor Ret n=1 Tax=Orchesella cincta TaxID=48709 RepID=A0A1D2ND18_ORCCI|nr:Proto-oncogene tyrosine-protein kinase receptor Ret [Orchesella cincta]
MDIANITHENFTGVLSAAKAGSQEPLPNMLITKAGFDREEVELYNFSVSCIVTSSETPNKHEVIATAANLRILDENDNTLISSSDGTSDVTVYISLSDIKYHLEPGKRLVPRDHSELLARDNDTVDVNNFKIYNLNDTKRLLELDFTQHQIATEGSMNYTALIPKLKLSEHVQGLSPWEGDYCVAAVINDSTVAIPEKRDQDLKYTICVSWGQKPSSPRPESQSTDYLLSRLSNHVDQARMPRSTQRLAPVLSPFPDLVTDVSDTIAGLEFSIVYTMAYAFEEDLESNSAEPGTTMIASADYNEIFDVTPHMGIIYLMHPELIQNSSFQSFQLQLLCNSSLIPSFTTNITITLESPVTSETLCDDELCSVHADSKSCEQSCGYGSPGKCFWRQKPGFNNSLSNDDVTDQPVDIAQYPTCSPHLGTCPDGKCDEMEQLFPHLCPQDCATKLLGFGRLLEHSNGRFYGINGEFCKGVGTCQDPTICSCAHLPNPVLESPLSSLPKPTNIVSSRTAVGMDCGFNCVMIYLAVSLIGVFIMLVTIYVLRQRKERKRKARSLNQSVMMTAAGIEIGGGYGDNTGNGTLISNAEYGPGGMNHAVLMVSDDQFEANQIVQVDIKWEIHRDDLTLEHVLGEGQFGRVLKGKLRGHSGGGHTPVAVKMLKVDAAEGSKSLWQEFMAEFSLLKQVDHPNVIKLLGACTTTGGPPYIVMEYAEYGALRSFLRKCRRVEKINGSHSALHWDNPDSSVSPASDPLNVEYVVTPREVLGFSWQIAKGMAYLSDMKMVHRDLAARNILLTRTKACKISDFGLTRDIYVDDAYQKKSKDRVPVKWLAPECLADELYTTKSDVWAFGVLVWELTTLEHLHILESQLNNCTLFLIRDIECTNLKTAL